MREKNDEVQGAILGSATKVPGEMCVMLHPSLEGTLNLEELRRALAPYKWSAVFISRKEIDWVGAICGESDTSKVWDAKNVYLVPISGNIFNGKHPYSLEKYLVPE